MSANNVIPYERFCAARKAKMEKVTSLEVELDWIDIEKINAARDFYRELEELENRFDYE